MEKAIGKTINLGTSYGLSEHGLSTRLGIDVDTANHFLQSYFMRFNGVFSWISSGRLPYDSGYVKTASGRRFTSTRMTDNGQTMPSMLPFKEGPQILQRCGRERFGNDAEREDTVYRLFSLHDELGSDTPKELVKQMNKLRGEAFQETAETLFKGIPFKSEAKQGKSWACKSIKEEADDETKSNECPHCGKQLIGCYGNLDSPSVILLDYSIQYLDFAKKSLETELGKAGIQMSQCKIVTYWKHAKDDECQEGWHTRKNSIRSNRF